jgi:hypothetical protein
MCDACKLLWSLFLGLFRSRASLEAENLALRQQIIVLRRTAPKRLRFNRFDRLIVVGLHRLFPTFEMPCWWSDPRLSFAGTVLVSQPIGAGGRGTVGEDHRCRLRIRRLIRLSSLSRGCYVVAERLAQERIFSLII